MNTIELKAQFAASLARAQSIVDEADGASRDLTAGEQNQVSGYMAEAKRFKAQIDDGKADTEIRRMINDLGKGLEVPGGYHVQPGEAGRGTSAGEQFVSSPDIKRWLGQVAPGGLIPDSAKGLVSPRIQFKGLLTGDSPTSAGAMVSPDVQKDVVSIPGRPLTLRNIVTLGKTTSDTVEFARVTSVTNAAAPVPEATATAGASGLKPESAMALEKVGTNVITIAHWLPATRRALSDAGQLRTLIDNFLRYGLEEEIEDQMVNGDGLGENLTGIANTSGIQAQAWDTDILTTTRKGRTKVRTVGRAAATAFLLHPDDWERLDLLKDLEGRYIYGGPQALGQPQLWGLPVVECEALTAGTGYVGDFRQVVLWDREQASVMISESHADWFVRNLLAILAECRVTMGILRPSALVEMDLTAI